MKWDKEINEYFCITNISIPRMLKAQRIHIQMYRGRPCRGFEPGSPQLPPTAATRTYTPLTHTHSPPVRGAPLAGCLGRRASAPYYRHKHWWPLTQRWRRRYDNGDGRGGNGLDLVEDVAGVRVVVGQIDLQHSTAHVQNLKRIEWIGWLVVGFESEFEFLVQGPMNHVRW
jgi:hypothetical protein